ncbi:MAG: hypothetical protein ACJ72W_15960 [Actinoallomurus sp.]
MTGTYDRGVEVGPYGMTVVVGLPEPADRLAPTGPYDGGTP